MVSAAIAVFIIAEQAIARVAAFIAFSFIVSVLQLL
jgi:hypothetical protein